MKQPSLILTVAVAIAALLGLVAGVVLWAPEALAEAVEAGAAIDPVVMRWGLVAAAGATGLSAIAAGHAVASVGSAGMGALAENPDLIGRILILVGLAEGIAIYGLIVSILIINVIT